MTMKSGSIKRRRFIKTLYDLPPLSNLNAHCRTCCFCFLYLSSRLLYRVLTLEIFVVPTSFIINVLVCMSTVSDKVEAKPRSRIYKS